MKTNDALWGDVEIFEHVEQQLGDRMYRHEVEQALLEHYNDAQKDGDYVRVEMYAAALIALRRLAC